MYQILSVHHGKVTVKQCAGDACNKVRVKYAALVGLEIETGATSCKIRNGQFSFQVPESSTALKVVVNKNLLFHPANCKNDFYRTSGEKRGPESLALRQLLKDCNRICVDTSGLDHTPLNDPRVPPYQGRVFGHQLGPHRSSRAMAMVHLAMYHAAKPMKSKLAKMAALVYATHDTLVHLFPSHENRLDGVLKQQIRDIRRFGSSKKEFGAGRQSGKAAAQAIIADRENDGSNHAEQRYGVDYIPSGAFGEWTQDPISKHPLALGSLWSTVRPFVVPSATFAQCPPPPDLMSKEMMMQFNEVKSVGGDGTHTPTTRSADQENQGIFWAYDGVPHLCAPPRLYNQLTMHIAAEQGISTGRLLELLAVVNVTMADACIVCWESKWHYKLWRPITAIRTCSATGEPEQPEMVGDPEWTPLGAPASNTLGDNFSPPFPAYPSGHATFGGALQGILKHYFDPNRPFTFVSDELNGVTTDNTGAVRPLAPRTFMNFPHAVEENGQSRMYLGIHFNCDKTAGITMGLQVAEYVLEHFQK